MGSFPMGLTGFLSPESEGLSGVVGFHTTLIEIDDDTNQVCQSPKIDTR